GEGHVRLVRDHLEGDAVALAEGGAQRLVAAQHPRAWPAPLAGRGGARAEDRLRPGGVGGAGEAHGRRHVVGGGAGPQPVEEPEALLREGERQRGTVARRAADALHPRLPLLQPLHQPAELVGGERLDQFRTIIHCGSPEAQPWEPSPAAPSPAKSSSRRSSPAPAAISSAIRSARSAMVVAWKRVRTGSFTPNRSRTREISCTPRSEWPPRAKKSSCTPTRDTPSTSSQSGASSSSIALRGAR